MMKNLEPGTPEFVARSLVQMAMGDAVDVGQCLRDARRQLAAAGQNMGEGARAISIALTHIETAAMWLSAAELRIEKGE